MHQTTTTRRTSGFTRSALLAGALVSPMALVACGDDGGADEAFAAFCDANIAIDEATFNASDEGDDPAVEAAMADIVEAAPDDDTREKVQATIDAFMALQGPPDDAFTETYGELVAVVEDKCGFHDLSVEAKDYEFSGIDGELDAGPTLVTFDNVGNEFHEVLIMRRVDGDDTPVAELLSMEEDEAMSHVQPIAAAFAGPGTTGWTSVDLEPGEYVVACFLPTGATQEAWDAMMAGGAEVDGQPHAMNGMTVEFEVTS